MNFYEILKTKKLGRGSPDYWTQLFAEHVGGKGEWKVTGVLPLTFTAKGGTAADWVIYGNDENGTENRFDSQFEQGTISYTTGKTQSATTRICSGAITIIDEDYYTFTATGANNCRIFVYSLDDTYIQSESTTMWQSMPYTQSIYADRKIKIVLRKNDTDEILPSDVTNEMLVKGNTAPDHYIPHQQGVGERTKNLFDKSNAEMKGHLYPISGDEFSHSNLCGSITVPCEPSKIYTIKKLQSTWFQAFTTSEYPVSNGKRSDVVVDNTATSLSITSRSDDHYLTVYLWNRNTDTLTYDDIINTVVVVQGSTAPQTYIPYGYQIPISCEHTISDGISYNKDKLLNFDGGVISYPPYQTTSDFIAVTQKEITISGTSVASINKLVRLCGYDESKTFLERQDSSLYGATEYSFTFALGSQVKYIKYSLYKTDINIIAKESNDYTFYIGDSPLTEGETVSKTSTGQDIELFGGENTVSTTLYNKPDMEIKYK